MKIAITADLHLTTRTEHPHRYEALEDILQQSAYLGVTALIIAGDLFDENRRDFHEFENILSRPENCALKVLVILGNHDMALKQSMFTIENLQLIDKPKLITLKSNSLPILFLPYTKGVSAGDLLEECSEIATPGEFILVSHGENPAGLQTPNPLERGVYMPLTRLDLEKYQPSRVFLGHTHVPFENGLVFSPGSPAAVDHSEIGLRSFLVYNLIDGSIEKKPIQTGPIYMREKFLVIPGRDDAVLSAEIQQKVAGWGFALEQLRRIQLMAVFTGCSGDRSSLRETVLRSLEGISLFPNGEPDFSEVLSEDDPALAVATELALRNLQTLKLNGVSGLPTEEEIQSAVFRLIYGGKV